MRAEHPDLRTESARPTHPGRRAQRSLLGALLLGAGGWRDRLPRARGAALRLGAGHWPGYGAGTIAAGEAEVAQKVTVALEDDLTGGPAKETVRSVRPRRHGL
jgi:hypothetical protein